MERMKKFVTIGACGLSCELCPRYYTKGTSRCPGCGSEYRICVGCPFITCCVKKKNLETCALCDEKNNCERLDNLLNFSREYDSFLSHKQIPKNLEFIKKYGLNVHAQKIKKRAKLLRQMLKLFDDGRSRSFYCVATTLLSIETLERSLNDAKKKVSEEGSKDLKARAEILKDIINKSAERKKIDLKLRKPPHWKK